MNPVIKPRLILLVAFFLAALALLSSVARAANEPVQIGELPEGDARTPTPAPLQASGAQTHTVFLPLILNSGIEIIGPNVPFGYGWNVHQHNSYHTAGLTSFNWIKFTDPPSVESICGANTLPYNVLLRINWAQGDTPLDYGATQASNFAWLAKIQSTNAGLCVDAFEVGNEPNLVSMYKGPVNPVDFADKLCAQYSAIKAVDPNYIVVSGGIAPTGHFPDPTQVMDEEDFLRTMLNRIRDTHNGDAGACFDALGYHNYGFRTGYTTPFTDTVNCPEGMCFQSAERIWNILSGEYGVYKRLWLTEMGWLRDYTPACGADAWGSVFAGFQNSDAEQAAQLKGAFEYARAHWPWAGAMFVFNLDFNERGYDQCYDEQHWFAVKNFPARATLEAMPKP